MQVFLFPFPPPYPTTLTLARSRGGGMGERSTTSQIEKSHQKGRLSIEVVGDY